MDAAAIGVTISIRIGALEVDLGEVSELAVVDEKELSVWATLCIHLNNSIILIMLHESGIKTIHLGQSMTVGINRIAQGTHTTLLFILP